MSTKPEQNYHPISMLPLFANNVRGMAEDTHIQLDNFKEAKTKPHVMDNHTIVRAIKVFLEQMEYFECYYNQFHRWREGQVTQSQKSEIEELEFLLTPRKLLPTDSLHRHPRTLQKSIPPDQKPSGPLNI